MSEIREIKTQQVDQKCPSCGQGYMRPNGIVNPSTPPSYEHQCPKCGYKTFYGVRYPYNV